MQLSQIPTKFQKAFAAGASGGNIRTIPVTTSNPDAASQTLGWPPATLAASGAGGVPPDGRDMNGLDNMLSAWALWFSIGGLVQYDATQQAAIGGYPKWSVVGSVATPGTYWQSTAENNTTNPDASGAGWTTWPSSASIPWAAPPGIGGSVPNMGSFTTVVAYTEILSAGRVDASDFQIFGVGFTEAFGQSGYQKLPTGLIIQWGRAASISAGGDTINFPVQFPNDCSMGVQNYDNSGGICLTDTIINNNKASFVVRTYTWSSPNWTAATGIFYSWVAVGY